MKRKAKLEEKPLYKRCQCGRVTYSKYEYKTHICGKGRDGEALQA